uniref:Uncharacterized protein n=1 Tax=Pristionchus pacificus TaxID=54126 RepID=A0A2A6BAF5_PRIPA|eukprot:PDM62847.1 hypothetical protein PRIPAC_50062 [Pristionchus pacificus]
MNELSDRITINESQLRMTNIDPCTNYLKGAESMEEGTLREGFSWSEKTLSDYGKGDIHIIIVAEKECGQPPELREQFMVDPLSKEEEEEETRSVIDR